MIRNGSKLTLFIYGNRVRGFIPIIQTQSFYDSFACWKLIFLSPAFLLSDVDVRLYVITSLSLLSEDESVFFEVGAFLKEFGNKNLKVEEIKEFRVRMEVKTSD